MVANDIKRTLGLNLLRLGHEVYQGIARTQSPTNKNCAPESPAFGVIAKVSQTEGAMERPRSGGTAIGITVSPVPGKYAESEVDRSIVWGRSDLHVPPETIPVHAYNLTKHQTVLQLSTGY